MSAERDAAAIAPRPRYRPEVDGLRALAILPILLFHFRIPPFSGGFVGVDVFFVISGYLITQLIVADQNRGKFSLARFYERRIRRIFPALFAMLAVVSAAALVLFFPVDLARYGKSLLATAGFGANFEFWRETGYFDVIAEDKPLLHLWSIAVEEQFYLLFPAVLLLFGNGQRKYLVTAIGAIFALSLGLSVWGVVYAPAATFYLLPGRGWELMLGALLGLRTIPELASSFGRQSLATLGVVMILAAIFAYSRETPFPGPTALLPCLGAALVIYAGSPNATAVGALLAARPLVFVGRISYSLYLWHWPLFVFARYLEFRDPQPLEKLGLLVLSFALATASWYFVEQPFRGDRLHLTQPRLFAGGATAMGLCAALAALFVMADGFPQRLRPSIRTILAEEGDHEPRIDTCFGLTPEDVRAGRLCRIGLRNGTPSFLLWGDSHADAVLPAVSAVAAREGRTGLFAGGHSCPPLLDVTTPRQDCRAFNANVLAVAARPEIREVILEARWAKYAEGSPYGDEPEGRIVLTDGGETAGDGNHAVFARGLARTVQALAGKKIVIVAAVPEIGWPVPAVLARESLADKTRVLPPNESAYFDRQKFVMAIFSGLERSEGVTIVYPHEVLCRTGVCQVSSNGIPLYRDEHHLSVYGALKLTPLFQAAL